MRETKFRAWNDGQGRMFFYDPKECGYDASTGRCDVPFSVLVEEPHFHVMQYTGIKDIAEKEIYEGDIVSVLHGRYTGPVVWMNDKTGYGIEGQPMHLGIYGGMYGDNTIVVLGNIYEHPNLLKDGNN